MFRSMIVALTLFAFMTASAALVFAETATKKADSDKTEFEQKAKAKFDEYDKEFKQWSEKAKAQSEKFYQDQKKDLEKHRAEAAKDIQKLNASGKESWGKLKAQTNKALDEFGKSLERAGAKLRKK